MCLKHNGKTCFAGKLLPESGPNLEGDFYNWSQIIPTKYSTEKAVVLEKIASVVLILVVMTL